MSSSDSASEAAGGNWSPASPSGVEELDGCCYEAKVWARRPLGSLPPALEAGVEEPGFGLVPTTPVTDQRILNGEAYNLGLGPPVRNSRGQLRANPLWTRAFTRCWIATRQQSLAYARRECNRLRAIEAGRLRVLVAEGKQRAVDAADVLSRGTRIPASCLTLPGPNGVVPTGRFQPPWASLPLGPFLGAEVRGPLLPRIAVSRADPLARAMSENLTGESSGFESDSRSAVIWNSDLARQAALQLGGATTDGGGETAGYSHDEGRRRNRVVGLFSLPCLSSPELSQTSSSEEVENPAFPPNFDRTFGTAPDSFGMGNRLKRASSSGLLRAALHERSGAYTASASRPAVIDFSDRDLQIPPLDFAGSGTDSEASTTLSQRRGYVKVRRKKGLPKVAAGEPPRIDLAPLFAPVVSDVILAPPTVPTPGFECNWANQESSDSCGGDLQSQGSESVWPAPSRVGTGFRGYGQADVVLNRGPPRFEFPRLLRRPSVGAGLDQPPPPGFVWERPGAVDHPPVFKLRRRPVFLGPRVPPWCGSWSRSHEQGDQGVEPYGQVGVRSDRRRVTRKKSWRRKRVGIKQTDITKRIENQHTHYI